MPNILILHLLSYGITSSNDGNLNAQKLSNRSRLVNYFDFVCSRDMLQQQQQPQQQNSSSTSPSSSFKSPITTRRQSQAQQQQHVSTSMQHPDANLYKHQFRLFAVVMHSGVSLNSGHYTAFINYKIISQNENYCTG
jgi:uncharacterized UBP type Zn finger protein